MYSLRTSSSSTFHGHNPSVSFSCVRHRCDPHMEQQQQQPNAGLKSMLLEALGLQPGPNAASCQDQHDAVDLAAAAADAAPSQQHAGAPAATSADAHDAAFAARLASICKQFTSDASAARDAQQFLQEAHSQAQRKEAEVLAAADAAYTPAWRRTGLPSKPSQLQLDDAALSGSRLLNPAAIIARQQAQQQKEVLQPPAVFAYCDKSAAPHFLQTTGNQKVRQGIAAARTAAKPQARPSPKPGQQQQHAAAPPPQHGCGACSKARLQSTSAALTQQAGAQVAATSRNAATPWSQLPADEAASKVAAAAARYKAMAAIMTPEQQQIEEKIIKSMYQRLSFLRNPRYAVQQGPAPRTASGAALKGSSTAHRRRAGAVAGTSCGARPGRYDERSNIRAAEAGFSVVPAQGLLFDAYVPGGVYFQTVQLQNVGTIMKQLRLLPPTSRYFQVSFPRFPLESSALAPGICAEVDVCFTPDSLGDYEDAFSVESPAGGFEVQLTGMRPHPKLSLAPVLEVGSVLVGNRRSRTIEFVNQGGAGCFLLMTAQQWAATLQQHEQDSSSSSAVTAGAVGFVPSGIDSAVQAAPLAHTQDSPSVQAAAEVRAGPFSISPAYLELPAGAAAVLAVEFSPDELGRQSAEFVLVFDNCTASPLRVEGYGEQVQVQLVGLDDREWLPQDAQMPLWLGQVCPGASSSRRLRVMNATELPFPFRWTVQGASQPGTFAVTPAAGVLQARAEQEFVLEFAPPLVGAHSATLTLSVQRSGDAGLLSITQWGGEGTAIVHVDASATTAPYPQVLLSSGRSGGTGAEGVPASQEAVHGAEHCSSGTAGREPCPGDSAWESVVELGVEGVGLPISLSVLPAAALSVPGVLTVGQQACLPLQLCNDTAAPAHYSIAASSSTGARGAGAAVADVHVTPSQGVVPPHGETQLSVNFTALAAGICQQVFAVEVLHGPVQQLQAEVEVQQVRVVPGTSSLNLGVLCVGASTSCTLQLHNTATDCRSYWCIQQQQGGQAAAVPPTLLSFQPSHGWLDPLTSCSATVTVTGSCEGAQRLLMCVKSSSTACSSCTGGCLHSRGGQAVAAAHSEQPGCCSCSAEYVQLLVLVSSPKVSLSKHRLPIHHAYIGVPQHHSIVMTNTSSLPLTFSWKARQQQHQQVLNLQKQLQQQVATTNAVCVATANSPHAIGRDSSCGPHSSLTCAASSGPGDEDMLAVGRIQLGFSPNAGQLQPGESVRLQLQVEPTAVGPVAMLCCCHVPAMQQLVGFLLTADVGGLQVQYSILHPEDALLLPLLLQQQQRQAGCRASSPAGRNRASSPPGHSRVGSPPGHRASSPPGGGRSHLSSRVASGTSPQAGQQQQQQVMQPNSSSTSAPDVPAGQGKSPADSAPRPAGAKVLAADFGQVSLHQPAELLLQVTNLTSICSTVTAWMGEFGAHRPLPACASFSSAACAGAKSSNSSSSAWPCETVSMQHEGGSGTAGAGGCSPVWSPGSRQSGSKSRSSSPLLPAHTRLSSQKSAGQVSAAPVAGKLSRTDPCTYSGRRVDSSASIPAEALITTLSSIGSVSPQSSTKQGLLSSADSSALALKGPFRAFAGNSMMAARQAAAAAAAALGPGSKGCAVQLLPEACQLPGWGSCLLRLQAFNSLPGSYCDTLYVQAGELPPCQIPVSLQVVGSPLTISKHRVQRPASDVLHALLLHPAPGAVHSEGSGTTSSSSSQHSRPACSLDFGVVTAGLEVQKTFVISNTGPLPVQLAWDWKEADALASTADTHNRRRDSANSAVTAGDPGQPEGRASAGPSRPESAAVLDAETADAPKQPPSSASSRKAGAKVLPSGPVEKAAAGLAKSTASAAASSTPGAAVGGHAGAKQEATARAWAGSAVATGKKGARGEPVAAGEAVVVQQQQEGVKPQDAPSPAEAAPEDGVAAAGEEVTAATAAATEASTQPPLADELHAAGYDALLPPGGPSSLLQALQQGKPCNTQAGSALDSAAGGHSATSLFSITPPACVVPPHGQQQFLISFCSSRPRVVQSLVLRGRQRFCCPADDGSQAGRLRLHLLPDPAAEARLLQCRITGSFHPFAGPPPSPMPALSAALSAVVVAPQLLPADPDSFCWHVTTTHDPSTHASYLQTATLCNATGCPQVFRLAVQGPFQLVAAVPSVVQDADAFRGMQGSGSLPANTNTGRKAASQQAGADSLLLLPPGEAVDVSVRFMPALPLRPASGTSRRSSHGHPASLAATGAGQSQVEGLAGPPSHATEHDGALVVTYSTGQQQALPLRGAVLQPELLVSPEAGVVEFGSVHAAAPRTLEVVLTNPVDADATWEAAIQPLPAAAVHAAALDAGVASFTVVPLQGVLPGRGLGMPQQARLRVTCTPAHSGLCAAELHLAVRGGRRVAVSLRGQGVHAEGAERAYDL